LSAIPGNRRRDAIAADYSSRKPQDDLGTVTTSKARAAHTVPISPPRAPAVALRVGGGVKSLTVKLEGELYATLCTYCYQREHVTRTKLPPQQVIVEALPKSAA
jgi:hypothetical protein